MKLNMRLTVLAAIRAEQLLEKPFGLIDHRDENDVLALLYCCALCNHKERFSFERFRGLMKNEKQRKRFLDAFTRENKIDAQFGAISSGDSADEIDPESIPEFLSRMVTRLIVDCGIDPHYVLHEMNLSDVSLFVEAYERRLREGLENDRLWTYYGMLPHVGSRRLKGVRDLCVFPWEREVAQREVEENLSRDRDVFDAFMREGKDFFSNV